jgi:hypothetical protein
VLDNAAVERLVPEFGQVGSTFGKGGQSLNLGLMGKRVTDNFLLEQQLDGSAVNQMKKKG